MNIVKAIRKTGLSVAAGIAAGVVLVAPLAAQAYYDENNQYVPLESEAAWDEDSSVYIFEQAITVFGFTYNADLNDYTGTGTIKFSKTTKRKTTKWAALAILIFAQ